MGSNSETAPGNATTKHRRFVIIGVCLVAIIAAIVIGVYFVRLPVPEVLIVSESNATETLPALVKAAPIGNGAIVIMFTESLKDDDTVFYYVNFQDLNTATLESVTDPDNVALYLTQSSEPTIADGIEMQTVLRIGLVNDVAFPLLLPESFDPEDYLGTLLVQEAPWAEDTFEIFSGSFKDSTNVNENEDGGSAAAVELPPILFSQLSGEYGIKGTVTIDYITKFQDGQIKNAAVIQFDIPAVNSAPGPFLFLSKRPFLETKNGDITNEDVAIDLDDGDQGGFTVMGRFEQVLDEIDNVQDLNDYKNGSWIVWCKPYSVWLGGGPISTES